FVTFLDIEPLANLGLRVGRLDEAKPVAARAMALLRENFDDIAIHDFVAKRDHLAVNLGADALVSNFGVHEIREIDGSGAAGKLENAALWGESVDLDGSEIHFQGVQEVAWLLKLLGPLDKLSHPGDALVVVGRAARLAGLVLPVSGDAFLGEAVHVLGADLDLEGLAAMQDRGVQRLVEIGPGKGEIVLKAAGDR